MALDVGLKLGPFAAIHPKSSIQSIHSSIRMFNPSPSSPRSLPPPQPRPLPSFSWTYNTTCRSAGKSSPRATMSVAIITPVSSAKNASIAAFRSDGDRPVCKAIGSTTGVAPLLQLLPLLILLLLPPPLLLLLLLFLSLLPVLLLLLLVLLLVLLLSTSFAACLCSSASFNRSTSWALAQKTRVDPSRSHGSTAAFDRTLRSFIHTFIHSKNDKRKRKREEGRGRERERGEEGGVWQYVRVCSIEA